jgi:hypothetical protein
MYRRPPDHRRCTATTKDGRRCQLWRFGGGEVCLSHDAEAQALVAECRDWLYLERRTWQGWALPVPATGFDIDRWAWERRRTAA